MNAIRIHALGIVFVMNLCVIVLGRIVDSVTFAGMIGTFVGALGSALLLHAFPEWRPRSWSEDP